MAKPSLFILHNDQRVQMSIKEIFDTEKYDTFQGVTYSANGDFINKYLSDFSHIKLIIGAGEEFMNSQIYNKLGAIPYNMVAKSKQHANTIKFYQTLSDKIKAELLKHDIELYSPLKSKIHSKFYLLSNTTTGDTRIIKGSANLSNQAFNTNVPQFEMIEINDNSKQYAIYQKYLTDELIPTTSQYFNTAYNEMTKFKLANKPKQAPINNTVYYTKLTDEETSKLEPKAYATTFTDLTNDHDLDIPKMVTILNDELDNEHTITKQAQNEVKHIQSNIKLVHDTISKTAKTPKFKTKAAIIKTYTKIVHIKQMANGNKQVMQRSIELISEPEMRTNNTSGLYIPDKNEKLHPMGNIASKQAIKQNLMAIQHLMDNYLNHAIDADNKYCSRIMEAILYAFEAPFLYEVRQKAIPLIEGQDIPQFLFIGGQASTGKSSLLKVIIKLLGLYSKPSPQLYSDIMPPDSYHAGANSIKQIQNWINTENVAPLIFDDIEPEFFSNKKYGEKLITDETNHSSDKLTKFPVVIGSTNSKNYNIEDRAKRRSYYLNNDCVFDAESRSDGGIAYQNVISEMNNKLFNDFCIRYAKLLETKDDDFWHDYGKSKGLYDFLWGARLIFKEYYQECNMKLPKWFPETRANDEKETGRNKWRKLFEAHEELFKTNKQNKKTMFLSINEVNKNADMTKFNKTIPAEEYRNDLNPKVVIGNKNSTEIEIDKKRFFQWIHLKPKHNLFGFLN